MRSSATQGDKLADALAELKISKLKVTRSRQLVLAHLTKSHGPFSVEEIHLAIQSRSCNLTTVYRILNHFVEIGIVRKTDLGDRVARYEYQSRTHSHHHLICRVCKKVEILSSDEIPRLDKITKSKGFSNINPWLEIFGTCKTCSR